MNLFTQTLAAYLTQEWDRALSTASGPKEARFIVQSLGSEDTLALFEALEAHSRGWAQRTELVCYFRVATGLRKAWSDQGSVALSASVGSAIAGLEGKGWIDQEDRLTWYRNRTAQDENVAGLVVVLVGLNHATDQGGLADFHRVDESRLIAQLKGSFQPWLQRICSRLGLNPGETELDRFDTVLRQLFELRPLRLVKLAEFLEPLIEQGHCYSFLEFRERCFKAMPFWEIPPLLADGPAGVPNGPEAAKALGVADAFISHQGYKTKAGQSKDLKKIDKALDEPGFVPPVDVDGKTVFSDLEDYRGCLKAFIVEADPEARKRLLRVDFTPIYKALSGKKKKEKGDGPTKLPAFQGMSFEALLQGVWDALLKFEDEECGDQPVWQRLAGIHVRVEAFHHDLSGDEVEGVGEKELAGDLIRGCLGGLEQRFADMDLRLPLNLEQVQGPPAHWERKIDIDLDLALDGLAVSAVRGSARPYVQFRVSIADVDRALPVRLPYRWYLDADQPERVLHGCARQVQRAWESQTLHPHRLLPAFRIGRVDLTALFFAADADEANRLVSRALGGLELVDLRKGLHSEQLDQTLRAAKRDLIHAYRKWLGAYLTQGYYKALFNELPVLLSAYEKLAGLVLDPGLLGAPELLRRFYKAFLLVDDRALPNDHFLAAAVAWGLSPSVLELSLAQTRFLADGFPEAVAELGLGGKTTGKPAFERLLDLSRIQRPVTALVTDPAGYLSTKSRSFGLVHCLGEVPEHAKSLAVQTLLREDETSGDEDASDVIRGCEEQPVVMKVLDLYRELHPYAEDGLRILALNVRELPTILAGVDAFLKQALKLETSQNPADIPPFCCTLMVYSMSSSPLAMESGLTLWRDRMVEGHRERGRALTLTVGHRFAPKGQMLALLFKEGRLYDLAFLFHFLRTDMNGRVDPASPFDMGQDGAGGFFPIAEYPRPIRAGDRYRRQMVLSNRRLRIQTRHSDLSARLRSAGHMASDFVVYGEVDFGPWADVIGGLHKAAQWVACVDSFVDKRLLSPPGGANLPGPGVTGRRKIVGFQSGLGAYGELNLTISTEQDTLDELVTRVASELHGLLPFQQADGFQVQAERIVAEAEEIIGLASLQAVLGQGEQLREVVGFAAIRRMLKTPPGPMSQLLPLDALGNWFSDADAPRRPDLLQLSLEVRPNDVPLVHATVVECKLAAHNTVYESEALEQVTQGLKTLSARFAPRGIAVGLRTFDQRYWWAQLHRAIASRAVVSLAEIDWRGLDHALENLAEGRFEICWRGAVFTFWTNVPMPDPTVSSLIPSEPVTAAPISAPAGFVIEQVQLGYQGLASLFATQDAVPSFSPSGPAICLRPDRRCGCRPAVEDTPASNHTVPPEAEVGRAERGAPADGGVPGIVATTPTAEAPSAGSAPGRPDESPEAATATSPPDAVRPAADVGTQARQEEQVVDVAPFLLPDRILIGTRTNREPVFWHFGHPQLQNRHLLIFGTSGSGKTYGIQCLLAEMANAGLRSLIVDYTDGFLPNQVEPRFKAVSNPKDHFVYTERLPLNPFRRQRQVIDPARPPVEEGAFQVASRIESIFASVFEMGDQQSAALIRSLQSGLDLDPGFSLDKLLPRLREDSPQGETLANKLEPLIQAKPFREGAASAWNGMLTSPGSRVHVLQLKGLAREIQKLVTEFVLWDLWDYAQSTGNKNRPIPIVLDEIQNLDHSSDSPIDKMLREGRKFGVGLMLATQTTSQFNQEQRDRLFQAGHKLFFKPAMTEIDRFAQILTQATSGVSKPEWALRLARLEKGQCWSLGPVLRSDGSFKEEAVLVSVTSLESRRFEG
jgi:DNA phosphorothioation-dependent restriction protein DptH